MKQKWMTLVLALALTASLAACGGQTGSGSTAAPDGSTQPAASSPAESGPAESVPAESDAAGSEEPPASSSTEDGEAAASKPAESAKPSKPASSGASSAKPAADKSVDLAAFYDSISGGEDFPAMMALEDDLLDALYEGLSELDLKQCLVYTPMISSVGAEVALVEVASAGDVQAVKDIFQKRVDYQIEQGAFYPQTIETWENDCRIVSNGNYILLACLHDGGCDDIVDAFNKLF